MVHFFLKRERGCCCGYSKMVAKDSTKRKGKDQDKAGNSKKKHKGDGETPVKKNSKKIEKPGNSTSKGLQKKTGGGSGPSPKGTEKTTSTSTAQKREVKKERQSNRRHAETVAEAKSLWNKLRVKTNSSEEIKELMDQVMKLIRGKVSEIALQHDASRVVQSAIQFGSDEQRKEVLNELCQANGGLPELSKIQYAHFCSLKLIKYCGKDEDLVKTIVKVCENEFSFPASFNFCLTCIVFQSFKGTIPKLAVHAILL